MKTNRLLISSFILWLMSSMSLAQDSVGSEQSSSHLSLQIIDPFVEMHSGPGRAYPVFHVVEQGETVTVLKRQPDWYQIKTANGKIGWTKARQLSRTLQPTGIPVDLPSIGHGDYLKNGWRVGFTGGQITKGDIKGADTFSVNAGYRAFTWLGTELEWGKIYSKKVRGDLYGFNILVEPIHQWQITPYVLLGTGKMKMDAQPGHTDLGFDSSSYRNYALGANYYLARNFVIKTEYRWYSVSTDIDTVKLEEWKIGFSTFF